MRTNKAALYEALDDHADDVVDDLCDFVGMMYDVVCTDWDVLDFERELNRMMYFSRVRCTFFRVR